MTKSQAFYYIAAVVIITLLVYLYTTLSNSTITEEIVPESKSEVLEEIDTTVSSTSSISDSLEVIGTNESVENYLKNTTWRWVGSTMIEGTEEAVIKPKDENAFILTFSNDNTISSRTDCNTLGGSYTISENNLSFGPMMSTLMYCEGSQETEYAAQLAQVQSVSLDADRLDLNIPNGKMLFIRIAE